MKQHDVEQAKCMRIDSLTLGCKEQHYDLMKENSFDDYIFSSFYNDEFKKKELVAEIVLSLNEISTDNLNREEKVQMEEKSYKDLLLKELLCISRRRKIQTYDNSIKFDCRRREKGGRDFEKAQGGYCFVGRRSERDQPIHLYAQNPNRGECQDFY